MSVVVGINGSPLVGHDPCVALAIDGKVVAAVEEERLLRVKRAIGQRPANALREVLDISGVSADDVDVFAIPWCPYLMGYDEKELVVEFIAWLSSVENRSVDAGKVRFFEHHYAHACSGLPFIRSVTGKRISALVLDGSGECTSGAAYKLAAGVEPTWHLDQAGSLGIYYEALAHYLGFRWGEEGKVTGLAAYGRASEIDLPELPDARIEKVVCHRAPKQRHELIRDGIVSDFKGRFGDLPSFNEGADLAFAVQKRLGEQLLKYAWELCARTDVLVYAGGFALNCAVNRELAALCERESVELIIPPVASDTGAAIGAAVAACLELGEGIKEADVYLGRTVGAGEFHDAANSLGMRFEATTAEQIAFSLLERDSIVGWCDGRAEVGPRSLGRRSILARCDSTRLRDKINFIKGRESWRPVAPSIGDAHFAACFPGECPSPHMLIAAAAGSGARKALAGVLHVDGTARAQVVQGADPYANLLCAVGKLSGVAAVTCTSFNLAGEPMVYSAYDALKTASAIGLDFLAGDGFSIIVR